MLRTRWWSSTAIVFAMIAALVAPPLSPVASAAPGDPNTAAAAVEPAVARIDTRINYQGAIGTGTGFVLDPNGQVLTNFHVVQGADSINTTVGGRSYPSRLIGYDRTSDIAVLELAGAAGLPVAPIGDSGALAVGEQVVALGNARGTNSPLTREIGPVTEFGRSVTAEDSLTGSSEQLTDLFAFGAPVRAGDSGGPVVNGAGQVVGVTTAATVNFRMGPAGEGFAIPINRAIGVAGQIRAGARSDTVHIGPPTLLGVGVSTADQRGGGVVIREVLRGGPAEAAGLVDGDVLLTLDGVPLNSATALTDVLDRHYTGDVIDLTWIDRSGQERTGKATVSSGTVE